VVLLVAPSPVLRRDVGRLLDEQGYQVFDEADPERALGLARNCGPDVVLLDMQSPSSRADVVSSLHADAELADVPVVLLAAPLDLPALSHLLASGAHDVLRTPIEPLELAARVAAAVRVRTARLELDRRSAELYQVSRTDVLTGLYNRRHLLDQMRQLSSAARRHGAQLSVLLADVDNFKAINDTLGHAAGDAALLAVAERMQAGVRKEDVVGRWGGEEFLALLPNTDREGARLVGERLRSGVADPPVEMRDHGTRRRITVSVGVSAARHGDVEEAVRRADIALYAAKQSGRNRVCVG